MAGLPVGVAVVAASFLIGATPWGYLAGKASGIDLRTIGSGGTGATNVLRTLGGRASAIVLVLDFLKGLVPVLVSGSLGLPAAVVAACGLAAVAGHCWSPFIGFRGGKGMATGAGATIALVPQTITLLPVMALVVWSTRYVSLGSLITTALAAFFALVLAATSFISLSSAIAIVAIAAIIFIRHGENIGRLRQGTERKLGERAVV
jgi:glycerol-3-phosphate acyltransferase PlsY